MLGTIETAGRRVCAAWWLVFGVTLLSLTGCTAPLFDALEIRPTVSNLAYGEHPRQKLDLYLPDAAGPTPLVVWIHGGGWNGGDKYRAYPARILTAAGFAVASIDYRFSSEAPFPAQINDCKGAIRWLRAHAGEYELDGGRVGVWGRSAGGHLAALVGTTGGVAELEGDVGGNLGFSSRVQAAADYCGPTDAFTFAEYADDCGSGEPPLLGRCLGEIVAHADDPDWAEWVKLARLASPVYGVSSDDPPFFIAHGTADTRVPSEQSQELYDAFAAAGVPATLDLVPRAGHGELHSEDAKVIEFFERVLGDPRGMQSQ